jgi:predicted DCC family thiol-disulfide oxidoreductase YuxK
MRIILGFVLLAQAQVLWRYRGLLLNPDGPVPWAITDAWVDPLLPKLSTLAPLFSGLGLGMEALVATVLGVHALAAAFMMVGYRTRLSVAIAWATFVLIKNTSLVYTYGLGMMLLIGLFYCLFMPVGREWSIDRFLDRRRDAGAEASLSVLVLRLHMCIVYAAAGFAKAVGEQWWSGEALWRALSLPQFRQFDPSPLAAWPLVLMGAAWIAILSQLAYPVLVWTRLRVFVVLLAELMHLGIAIFLGLWLFSAVMIALNTGAFGEALWLRFARKRGPLAAEDAGRASSLRIVYDGACPFCDDYVRYQRLRAVAGTVELVDARERHEVLAEHGIEPREMEDGMVVIMDGHLYRGADAMHLLSILSEAPDKWWIRAVAAPGRYRALARLAYPVLRLGRRIVLTLLGVPRFPSGAVGRRAAGQDSAAGPR